MSLLHKDTIKSLAEEVEQRPAWGHARLPRKQKPGRGGRRPGGYPVRAEIEKSGGSAGFPALGANEARVDRADFGGSAGDAGEVGGS